MPRDPALSKALAYRNPQIAHKFTESWDVSYDAAVELFTETKRLLWLIQGSRRRKREFMIELPLLILDEMWHTFVLFTTEYTAYCKDVYGQFVHHHPTTKADRDRMMAQVRKDPAATLARWSEAQEKQWELVEEFLGEKTLLKWYAELPMRYDAKFFRTKRITQPMTYRPPPELARMVRANQRARSRK